MDEQQDDDLGRTVRQKSQLELAFPPRASGEVRNEVGEASEIRTAKAGPESSTMVGVTMEAVVGGDNLRRALAQVRCNQGAPGIDGLTIEDLAASRPCRPVMSNRHASQPPKDQTITLADPGIRGIR